MSTLTALQVAAAAYAGGFRGDSIAEAVATSFGESSWNTDSHNDCCYGLMAINLKAHQHEISSTVPNWNWRDPVHNMQAAYMIWRQAGGTFRKDWSAYGNSRYHQALPQAKMAAAQLAQELSKDSGHQQDVIGNILGSSTNQVGSTPGPSVADSVAGAVTDIPGVREIGSFFSALVDPNTWLRVAEVAIGVLLIAVGLAKLAPSSTLLRATPVGTIARSLT